MGTHTVNVGGQLYKKRTRDGIVIGESIHQSEDHHDDHSHPHVDLNRIQQAFKDKEGCELVGHIIVNKVPGNFHISSHAYGHILNQVFHSAQISTIDLSHKINHISFGEEKDIIQIRKKFNKGVLNPLDQTQKTKAKADEHIGVSYNYYLSVVPTTYIDVSGNEYYVH